MNWKRAILAASQPVLAAALAVLVVWLAVFAPTSSFHAAFHDDGAGTHQCAICHFTKCQILAAGVPPVLAAIMLLVGAAVFAALPISLPSTDLRLAPGRAPPRFSRTPLR